MDVDRTTELLRRFAGGEAAAQQQLYAAVSEQLRGIAGSLMKASAAGHTLQPTALVHEAWIRLVSGKDRTYNNRLHFVGVAAKAMRSVLVDHVRRKRAKKRSSGAPVEALDVAAAQFEARADLLDLDAALQELERDDPELAKLVELRFFGGLTTAEVAEIRGTSVSTIERQWRVARARLHRRIGHEEPRRDALD
jgi:RNA polymerase sigma factor (TIGR02999 family)